MAVGWLALQLKGRYEMILYKHVTSLVIKITMPKTDQGVHGPSEIK